MSETSPAPMRGFEKFGLISGIVGLVADVIALIAFLTGFLNLGEVKGIMPSNPLLLIVTAVLLLYGWFSLAWVFARHGLNNQEPAKRQVALEDIAWKATIGVGVLLAPLAILWLIALSSLLVPTGDDAAGFWASIIAPTVFLAGVFGVGLALGLNSLLPLVYPDLA